jgi:preprotein translocase subunit SecF
MGKRRLRVMRRRDESAPVQILSRADAEIPSQKVVHRGFLGFYDRRVKLFTLLTLLITVLCMGQIAYQTITTGEFIHRGVSLKGGTTITIATHEQMPDLLAQLHEKLPEYEIDVKELATAGVQNSILVEAGITGTEQTDRLVAAIEDITKIPRSSYSVDVIGSSLGSSFFREIVIAIIVAFLFMAIVVFLYFRILMPSIIVVLCAFSDIVCTIAMVNILGFKVSTAGIAAFLMLIGYSVDTDILLTTRLLRRKEGSAFERTIGAAKTGLTMTLTSAAAVIVVLILSKSEVLNQIMTILLIGLIFDIVNTWVTNVGLLRYYMERKHIE